MGKLNEKINEYKYKKALSKKSDQELLEELKLAKKTNYELTAKLDEIALKKDRLSKEYNKQKNNQDKREQVFFKNMDENMEKLVKKGIELENKHAITSNKYRADIQKADEELERIKTEQGELFQKQADFLQADFEKRKDELNIKLKELEEYKQKASDDYEADIKLIEDEHLEVVKQEQTIIDTLNSTNDKLKNDYELAVQTLEDEKVTTEKEHNKMMDELKEQKETESSKISQDSKTNLVLIKEELLALNQQRNVLKKQLDDEIEGLKVHEKSLQEDLNNQLQLFKLSEERARQKYRQAEMDYADKSRYFQNLNIALQEELASKNKALNDIYTLLKAERSQKKKDLQMVVDSLDDDLRKTYNDKIGYYNLQLKAKKDDYENSLNQLKKDLDNKRKELIRHSEKLAEQKTKLLAQNENELNGLKDQQTKLQQNFNKFQEKYDSDLKARTAALADKKHNNEIAYQNAVQVTTLKLSNLKSECENAKHKLLKEIDIANIKIENKKARLLKVEKDIVDSEIQHKKNIEKLQKSIGYNAESLIEKKNDVEERLKALELNQIELEKDYQRKFSEIADDEEKIRAEHVTLLEAIEKEHQDKLSATNQEYQEALKQLDVENVEREKQLKESVENRKKELEADLVAKTLELEKYEKDIAIEIENIKNDSTLKIQTQKTMYDDLMQNIDILKVEHEESLKQLEKQRIDEETVHHKAVQDLYADFELECQVLNDDKQHDVEIYENKKAELIVENDKLQNTLNERKQYFNEERQKLQQEFETFKTNRHQEVFELEKQISVLELSEVELTDSNEKQIKSGEDKIADLQKKLLELKLEQTSQLEEYQRLRKAELDQYESSLNAATQARHNAYEGVIKQKQAAIELEKAALQNEYNQKMIALDDQIDELTNKRNSIYDSGESEYRAILNDTQSLQDNYLKLKNDHDRTLFETKQRMSLRQNEIQRETDELKAGYKATLDEYYDNYQSQVAMLEDEKKDLLSQIDENKKRIAFEKLSIENYRKNMELEQSIFEEQCDMMIAKKHDEIAYLNEQKNAIIKNHEERVKHQNQVFVDLDAQIKQVLADKPLMFTGYYQEFESGIQAAKKDYETKLQELSDANLRLLNELTEQQMGFVQSIKERMEDLLAKKNEQLETEKATILEISNDFANKKAEEVAKQNLLRLGLENEQRNFDQALEESSALEANGENDYQNLIDALNSDFETSKLKLQAKMQEETAILGEQLAQLKLQNDNQIKLAEGLQFEIDECNNKIEAYLDDVKVRFSEKCRQTETDIAQTMEQQRRQLDEFDILGSEIDPLFTQNH